MTYKEFEKLGYHLVEKVEAHAYYKVAPVPSEDRETGYDLESVNEHMFEVDEDSEYVEYIIYNKNGHSVSRFSTEDYDVDTPYQALLEHLKDLKAPVEKTGYDLDEWCDMFETNDLTRSDVQILNEKLEKYIGIHHKNFDFKSEDDYALISETFRYFDNMREYAIWLYSQSLERELLADMLSSEYYDSLKGTVRLREILALDKVTELDCGGVLYIFE